MIKEINNLNIERLKKNKLITKDEIFNELNNNPFGHYLFLEENNLIVGYIYYSDIYDRAEINQIEVVETHRNCGKGSILLKKAIELVDKNITLEVKKDNIAAIKLYEKFNFEKVAIRKGYYQGIDGVLMERKK